MLHAEIHALARDVHAAARNFTHQRDWRLQNHWVFWVFPVGTPAAKGGFNGPLPPHE
jgi:hypothetical protein